MYVRITDRCNMECAHCSYSSGPHSKVPDMDFDTFRRAAELCENMGDGINIGGGEPTIHPEFWDFLKHAVSHLGHEENSVWLATNGKRPTDALILAALAGGEIDNLYGIAETLHTGEGDPIDWLSDTKYLSGTMMEDWRHFSCTLSQDQWHDPIPGAVVSAFKRVGLELRDVGYNLAYEGRAIDIVEFNDKCPCTAIVVQPTGDVHACGCEDSIRIGHVFDDDIEDKLQKINDDPEFSYKMCGSPSKQPEQELKVLYENC